MLPMAKFIMVLKETNQALLSFPFPILTIRNQTVEHKIFSQVFQLIKDKGSCYKNQQFLTPNEIMNDQQKLLIIKKKGQTSLASKSGMFNCGPGYTCPSIVVNVAQDICRPCHVTMSKGWTHPSFRYQQSGKLKLIRYLILEVIIHYVRCDYDIRVF